MVVTAPVPQVSFSLLARSRSRAASSPSRRPSDSSRRAKSRSREATPASRRATSEARAHRRLGVARLTVSSFLSNSPCFVESSCSRATSACSSCSIAWMSPPVAVTCFFFSTSAARASTTRLRSTESSSRRARRSLSSFCRSCALAAVSAEAFSPAAPPRPCRPDPRPAVDRARRRAACGYPTPTLLERQERLLGLDGLSLGHVDRATTPSRTARSSFSIFMASTTMRP